jgi:hypothetical protein
MTSSTVLAALGVLTLVGRRYSPSPVRSRRRAASSRGADAIRTAEEDRRPAGGHRAQPAALDIARVRRRAPSYRCHA